MRLIKLLFGLIFTTITILIIYLNVKLYTDNFTKDEKVKDIQLQLNFLGKELKENQLGERMQNIFPEGFVFTNVLYGLSWCELGLADSNLTNKNFALEEALYAYNQINSSKAKSIFDQTLEPENGIFYVGWSNYLLSKILLLDSNFNESDNYKSEYIKNCNLIVRAYKQSSSPFLQSYQDQAWPADMCVAMASLKNFEKFYDNRFHSIITAWVEQVKLKVDPITKLIPHKVNATDGTTIEGARGCSISLILRLLSEIDQDFSIEQYGLYKKNFVSTTFGLPSILEYPLGKSGKGDIDSGPVIMGVGFSGTIVSIGTFAAMGDFELAENQYKTINTFGLGLKNKEMKKFIFGQMPIADAFIAWSRTSELKNITTNIEFLNLWAIKFHLISACTILGFWIAFFFGFKAFKKN